MKGERKCMFIEFFRYLSIKGWIYELFYLEFFCFWLLKCLIVRGVNFFFVFMGVNWYKMSRVGNFVNFSFVDYLDCKKNLC